MAKKKKKKQKQKVKSSFMNVVSRGAGGAITEKEVKFGKAMFDFGDPIITLLSAPDHDSDHDIESYSELIELITLIWNGFIDNESLDIIDELENFPFYGKLLDWEKLVPVMYERHKEMFPNFSDQSQRGKVLITQNVNVSELNVIDFMSHLVNEKVEKMISEDDEFKEEDILEELRLYSENNPESFEYRFDYGSSLFTDGQPDLALVELKVAYKLAVEANNREYIRNATVELLECLHASEQNINDFPWVDQPVFISAIEFEQKMFTYVSQNGGNAGMSSAFRIVIGDRFINPAEDSFRAVVNGTRLRLNDSDYSEIKIELV